jgi:subtilisin family serine protease
VIARVLLAAAALALAACAVAPERTSSTTSAAAAARQIVLTVRQPESLALGLTGAPSQRYLQRRYGPTPSVERTLSELAHQHRLERVDGWTIRSLGVYCEVFAVPTGRSVDATIASLSNDPRVELVQRMNLFRTETARDDDPYADLQSAARQMDVEEAHELATGRGVSIAVVDSAVDAEHPDLRGRISLTRNLVGGRPGFRRGEVHGTAVAGVIASGANNRQGIVGVAPDASIAALRACWAVTPGGVAARCSTFSLARALELAFDMQPSVVNLSLAGPDDPLLSQLLDKLIGAGIIVVAAEPEPDNASSPAGFPASHPKVIAARAADSRGPARPYELGAPATEVLTTTPGAKYAFLSGNSLAAAHISGVIALLKERSPRLDVDAVVGLLAATMTRSADGDSVNACRALERVTGTESCRAQLKLVKF